MEMFRQIAPNGITNREIHVPVPGEDLASQLDGDEEVAHDQSHLGLGVETHTGPIIGSPTDARFAVHRKLNRLLAGQLVVQTDLVKIRCLSLQDVQYFGPTSGNFVPTEASIR